MAFRLRLSATLRNPHDKKVKKGSTHRLCPRARGSDIDRRTSISLGGCASSFTSLVLSPFFPPSPSPAPSRVNLYLYSNANTRTYTYSLSVYFTFFLPSFLFFIYCRISQPDIYRYLPVPNAEAVRRFHMAGSYLSGSFVSKHETTARCADASVDVKLQHSGTRTHLPTYGSPRTAGTVSRDLLSAPAKRAGES